MVIEFDNAVEALGYLIETWEGPLPKRLSNARYRIVGEPFLTKGGEGKTEVQPIQKCGAMSLLEKYGAGRATVEVRIVFSA